MSEMQWYDWEAPRRRLQVWTKAILGGRRYRVQLDPAFPQPAGHSPDQRLIVVNPRAWGEETLDEWRALHDPPPEMELAEFQWQCAKGLAAHEVGHARFTGDLGTGLVKWLANSLEDERIERAMAGLYPALAPLFGFVGDVAWAETPPLDRDPNGTPVPDPDDPHLVLGACLLWRWEAGRERGRATKMRLSLANRRRWYEVKPLVERAWMAETSDQVAAIARDILERLGIPPDEEPDDLPGWLRELLEHLAALLDRPASGERRPGDEAERARPATGGDGEPSRKRIPAGDGVAGSVPDTGDNPTGGVITPKPFLDLVAQARPLANQLAAGLRQPAPQAAPEAVACGGRFELRQYVRTPDTPFIARTNPGDDVPRLAIQVLADRSGSMGVGPNHDDPDVRAWFDEDPAQARQQAGKLLAARLGLMVLHLACEELDVAHAITLFDGHVLVQDFDQHTEMTRALIAGWQGRTGLECITDHLHHRGPVLLARPEPVKVMIIIHDGSPVAPGDPDGIRRWQAEHEGRVLTIGVYLGDDEDEIAAMRGLFRHLVAATPEAFPAKLGNLLRHLVPRARRW